jgi:hypothetical protein
MISSDKVVIKDRFLTGDYPTEAHFHDWIDALGVVQQDNLGLRPIREGQSLELTNLTILNPSTALYIDTNGMDYWETFPFTLINGKYFKIIEVNGTRKNDGPNYGKTFKVEGVDIFSGVSAEENYMMIYITSTLTPEELSGEILLVEVADERGERSIDFQTLRQTSDQVASSLGSVILNGSYNKVSQAVNGSIINGIANQVLSGEASTILNGYENILQGNHALIAGGSGNKILQLQSENNYYNVVLNGLNNLIQGDGGKNYINGELNVINNSTSSAIFLGDGNYITGNYNFIANGAGNKISNRFLNGSSSIFNGKNNTITSSFCSILNGSGNYINSNSDFSLMGGYLNTGFSPHSIIFGINNSNSTNSICSFIFGSGNTTKRVTSGGGFQVLIGNKNRSYGKDFIIFGNHCTGEGGYGIAILGGSGNKVYDSNHSSIINGELNNLDGCENSAIIAGNANLLNDSTSSIIGVGYDNTLSDSNYSSILNGYSNDLHDSEYSTVAGGRDNELVFGYGFIGGGRENILTSLYGFIGGGYNNNNLTDQSAIVGGINNEITESLSSFIGGGDTNKIHTIAGAANVIVGGSLNELSGSYSSILGGLDNKITDSINSSVIGGEKARIVNDFEVAIGNGDGYKTSFGINSTNQMSFIQWFGSASTDSLTEALFSNSSRYFVSYLGLTMLRITFFATDENTSSIVSSGERIIIVKNTNGASLTILSTQTVGVDVHVSGGALDNTTPVTISSSSGDLTVSFTRNSGHTWAGQNCAFKAFAITSSM